MCLQHIKRKFIDCGEDDPDAKRIVEMINTLYQNEHKHKIGVEMCIRDSPYDHAYGNGFCFCVWCGYYLYVCIYINQQILAHESLSLIHI